MAGYKRVRFDVDEHGTLYLGFLRGITKEKEPLYDRRVVDTKTAKSIYEKLKKYYENET